MAHGVGRSIDEIGQLTLRQIRLLYGAALKRECYQRAYRIADVNAGFAGGKDAQEIMDRLLK